VRASVVGERSLEDHPSTIASPTRTERLKSIRVGQGDLRRLPVEDDLGGEEGVEAVDPPKNISLAGSGSRSRR